MQKHNNTFRPAAKQCYHCQGLGHVQADCPTLRISGGTTGGRCYICHLPGHLAVRVSLFLLRHSPSLSAWSLFCWLRYSGPAHLPVCMVPGEALQLSVAVSTLPSVEDSRGIPEPRCATNAAARTTLHGIVRPKLWNAMLVENWLVIPLQRDFNKCPSEIKAMCLSLSNNIQGHISRDCPAPNGGPLSSAGKVCYKCSLAGHISRDCPTNTNETVAPSAAEPTTEVAAADSVAPAASAPTTAVA